MSNIYITEPPTQGKIVLTTSYGEIDIELWPREAPLACRNFVQLCLEGYYDNTVVHRIIKDFMVQMGDPTGTGKGGQSIWGKYFKDELHGRIKFNHRGQVAMANENKPNSNQSQFFISLGACEWLNGKHTIFGKITGNTIFNFMRIGDAEVGEDDRPLEEIKFIKAEVLWNPFEDILPRDLYKLGIKSLPTISTTVGVVKSSQRKASKNKQLLSFGDEEEGLSAENVLQVTVHSSHDAKNKDTKLSSQIAPELREIAIITSTSSKTEGEPDSLVKMLSSDDSAAADSFESSMMKRMMERRKRMERPGSNSSELSNKRINNGIKDAQEGGSNDNDIEQDEDGLRDLDALDDDMHETLRRTHGLAHDEQQRDRSAQFKKLRDDLLRSKRAVHVVTGAAAVAQDEKKAFHEMLGPLEMMRQKHIKRRRDKGDREEQTLAKLSSFASSLRQVKKAATITSTETAGTTSDDASHGGSSMAEVYHGQVLADVNDNDESAAVVGADWHLGKLKFKKHIDDAYRMGGDGRSADDYVAVDTRKSKQ